MPSFADLFIDLAITRSLVRRTQNPSGQIPTMQPFRLLHVQNARKRSGSIAVQRGAIFRNSLMNQIIYLVGLVVVVMAILTFLGLR
jgi:hypothetical protein